MEQSGTFHRHGTMRLATAADEVLAMNDPLVRQNPGYIHVILPARVVTKLGPLSTINTEVIDGLLSVDYAYLMEMYCRINMKDINHFDTVCPECRHSFALERRLPALGGQGYDPVLLRQEIAFPAYHVHWDYVTLMNLDHQERLNWCDEVRRIQHEMNEPDQPPHPLLG